jgi:4-hydroxybenzoyl-CoA reductase subunit alpha
MTGHAVKEAASRVREQVLQALSHRLGVAPESIRIRRGIVEFTPGTEVDIEDLRTQYRKEHRGWVDNPEGGPLTFREASRMAFLDRGTIVGSGKYKPPLLGGKFKGAAVGTSPAYGCSAQVAELSVDMETGEITIHSVTGAHDCGQAINRTSVEGQMEGSVSMGIGQALFEAVRFAPDGRILNANLADYKIPTAADMPPLTAIVVETGEPNGPYGAKEVGEGAIMPTIPAVLNALYDATGVRFESLPVTSEQVLIALRSGG